MNIIVKKLSYIILLRKEIFISGSKQIAQRYVHRGNEIKILLRQRFQKTDADVKVPGFSEIYTIVKCQDFVLP